MEGIVAIISCITALIAAVGGATGIKTLVELKRGKMTEEDISKIVLKSLDNSDLKKDVQKIQEKLIKNDEATLCSIRNAITSIYEQYKDERAITSNMRENLCYLYEKYVELGGNSYIKQIYSEMEKWETK